MVTEQQGRRGVSPRRPAMDRGVAMRLAATEYERVVEVLDTLGADQWTLPTECPGWDVRAMAGHVLGMTQMCATVPELMRQQLGAQKTQKRSGGAMIDALTALQVAKNADLSIGELVEKMRVVGPRAARRRRRLPAAFRNRKMPEAQNADGVDEWWTFGYLFDVVLTRDPFMHRIDISRATGVPMRVTPEHEGVLVEDVVREWAGRHGKPVSLELSGPAGGTWVFGDGETIRLDALEFCRVVSGRGRATGLLAQQVPF